MYLLSILVVSIMVFFAIFAIIDNTFLNNKYGLGPEFMKGIEMIGPLCAAIIGIISLVPVIAILIENTITPIYRLFGLDPSMACTTILAIDMGGFQLAETVALDYSIGRWSGIVYGSMMGATIVFSIPVGLATIEKEDINSFSKGILFGIAAIPFGTLIGGLLMNISFVVAIKNLIIPALFSIFIIICINKYPTQTTKVFKAFSQLISIIAMIGLALAMIKELILLPLDDLGIIHIETIPVIRMIGSTSEGILVAGSVGLMLSGALPFIYCLNKWLNKPLKALSKKTGLSETGITGFLLTCANNMATFANLSKMNEREKVLNVAFAVCAAFVIGDHLAFTAANAPECIVPMIIAKLSSGIIAVFAANMFSKEEKTV